jgi:hypothetical protein
MNALAAAAIASGELICEFTDGYRRSFLAEIAGDPPRVEAVLIYEVRSPGEGAVLDSRRPGRRPVAVREDKGQVHFIQEDGPSVRVTTLTDCTRTKIGRSGETCTRFSARHAWHFDTRAHLEPDESFHRQPSGAASGSCEPWRVD